VLITCWSSKGGSGTTVVAAGLAALLAAEAGTTLLVDLGGDLPAALGLAEPTSGLTAWGQGPSGPTERARQGPSGSRERARQGPSERALPGLSGLEVDAGAGVRLLPRGPGGLSSGIGPALAMGLINRDRVVVDAGVVGGLNEGAEPALDLAAAATVSLLVIRPCFLALRRAVGAPLRGSGVVLVDEPGRSLGRSDVEAALGLPVVAVVPWDPGVARRVDAGLLGSGLPRVLARALLPVVRAQGCHRSDER